MTDNGADPVDHARTTLPRAGESMKDNRGLVGYVLMGLAIVAVAICLAAAATGHQGVTIGAGVVAVAVAVTGSVWVFVERRRTARLAHPAESGDQSAQPPA